MMTQGRIEHVNLTVTDIERSAALFEQLLGCERTGRFPAYVESDVLWDEDEDSDGLEWGDAA